MSSSDAAPEISINIKGPSELKIQITISTDKTVLDLKQAIAEKSEVEADRQRLIYSGKVLKDDDLLSMYKIQSSHTIHMVKGAARAAAAAASTSTPQPLPTMQAGQNPSDPLTLLNSHLGHGVMAGFNPFEGFGVNPSDPNMLQGMMESPQFLQQMTALMSNPAIVDQIIASNPQLQSMGPQIRQVFQSEQFRQLMGNPESLRTMLQMSSMMRNAGQQPGGPGLFGAPTQPSTVPNTAAPGSAPFNPSLWPPFPQPQPGAAASAGATTGTTGATTGTTGAATGTTGAATGTTGAAAGTTGAATGTGAPTTPGLIDPALMQQLLGGLGGGGFPGLGAGLGALGGAGAPGFGAPPVPTDTRSPEERFEQQLRQLQEMGFTNAAQNVRALLATGGNVHGAIEYILSGNGLS